MEIPWNPWESYGKIISFPKNSRDFPMDAPFSWLFTFQGIPIFLDSVPEILQFLRSGGFCLFPAGQIAGRIDLASHSIFIHFLQVKHAKMDKNGQVTYPFLLSNHFWSITTYNNTSTVTSGNRTSSQAPESTRHGQRNRTCKGINWHTPTTLSSLPSWTAWHDATKETIQQWTPGLPSA